MISVSPSKPRKMKNLRKIKNTADPHSKKKKSSQKKILVKRKLPSPVSSPDDSNVVDKTIKFRSIGKRTVPGAKNGKKKVNQDSIFIDTHILGKGRERISLFAVFDGHGQNGDKVSRFLIGNLKDTFRAIYGKVILQKGNLQEHEAAQKPKQKIKQFDASTQASRKPETELYYKMMTQLCLVLNHQLNS